MFVECCLDFKCVKCGSYVSYVILKKYGKENDWIPFNLCELEGMSVLEFTVNYRLHHCNVTFSRTQ